MSLPLYVSSTSHRSLRVCLKMFQPNIVYRFQPFDQLMLSTPVVAPTWAQKVSWMRPWTLTAMISLKRPVPPWPLPHMSGRPAGNTHCETTFGNSLPIDAPMNEPGPRSMPVDRRYSSYAYRLRPVGPVLPVVTEFNELL